MADGLQVIRTFLTAIDAQLARGALEAAGIDAIVRADDCGGTRPHLWTTGVQLLVREEDAADAEAVLSSDEDEH